MEVEKELTMFDEDIEQQKEGLIPRGREPRTRKVCTHGYEPMALPLIMHGFQSMDEVQPLIAG